jgi:hypothetical protein
MSTYTNRFGDTVVQYANVSYLAIALTGEIELSWPTQFQDTSLVVAHIMDVTPTVGAPRSITMPDATQTSVGQDTLITNLSGATPFNVLTNTGALIATIAAGNALYIYLTNNSTASGAWRTVGFGLGVPVITSIGATALNPNLVITSTTTNPITAAGTFEFNLARDLLALTSFAAGTGMAARTAADTWALRTITGTANQVSVANGNGVAGNPTLSLPAAVVLLTSLSVANLSLSTNVIGSLQFPNGDIVITPNGTGDVIVTNDLQISTGHTIKFYNPGNTNFISFQGGALTGNIALTWPAAAPAIGQVLGFSGAGLLSWETVTTFGGPSTVNALAKYQNITGSLKDSGVILTDAEDMTGLNSITVQNILIGTVTGTTIATSAGSLVLSPNGPNDLQSTNTLAIMNGNALKLMEPTVSGANYFALRVTGDLAAPVTLDIPATSPAVGNILAVTAFNGGTNLGALSWIPQAPSPNFITNGGMEVWQRGTTINNASYGYINNDDTYTADRWILLSNGNNIVNVTRDTGVSDANFGSSYSMRLTVVTGTVKFGIFQVLEGLDSSQLVGKNASLSFAVKANGITGVRAAIVSWTGAVDAVTSDLVAVWNAAGANPTLVANWTYENVPDTTALTVGYANNYTFNVSIDTVGTTNVGVFIWADDTTSLVGATMNITGVRLVLGATVSPLPFVPIDETIQRCQRYFQKDFPIETPIGTAATQNIGASIFAATGIATATRYGLVQFVVPMRTTPTTVRTYSITALTDNVASNNAGADLAVDSATTAAIDATGFAIVNTSGGNINTTAYYQAHWYADAEL